MYRKLASALLVASAISSQYAVAVSLGEITMHSALNEPLKADIKLSNAESLDASQLAIRLASPEEFERAGIERTFFHSDINFSIQLDGKGAGVVHLSSKRRLNEPFLDVLLESKWPTGRMLRSYTVLVDLPVYEEPQAIAVDAPKATTKSTQSTATQNRAQSAAPANTAKVNRAEQSSSRAFDGKQTPIAGEEYRTQRNDTLWVIAERISQGQGISINQAMLSVQSQNKHAFINGNINRLKAGVVLRLPSVEDMRSVSTQTAQQVVSQHNQQWKNAQLDGTETRAVTPQSTVGERQGHLRLTSAGAGSAAGKSTDGTVVGGSQQLAAANDEIAAAQLENKALSSKVDSLGSQVEQLQRLIELKNAELASLQQQLGKEGAKASDTAVKETILADKDQGKPAAATGEKKTQTDTAAVKETVKTEKKPAAVKPVAAPAPAVTEPGLLDTIKQNPIYIGILGLLIPIGLVAFILRRRSQAEKQLLADNDSFSFDDIDEDDQQTDDDQGAYADVQQFEDDNEQVDAPYDDADLEEDAVLQTGDAIGEADIYVAYGRYDQAASLLKTAINKSPNNTALRSKLLEVYLGAKDKEGFQQTFIELQERGEHDAIVEAKELLSTSDAASDWLDDLPESAAPVSSLDDSVDDLDDAFDIDASTEDDDLAGFATDVNEDFNLDLDGDSSLDNDDLSGFASDVSEDFSLDLDSSTDTDLAESDELDLSDAFNLDDDALSEDDSLPESAIDEDDLSADLALDELNDSLDDFSSDLSALDETQLDLEDSLTEDDDTLSLDTFNVALDSDDSSDELDTDGFSLDDLDLDLAADDTDAPAAVGLESPEEDILSLDDLDFSTDDAEASRPSIVDTTATDEPELSLDDFDLDFDDLTSANDVADVADDSDSSSFDSAAAAASFTADEEPHVSAELDSLDDDDFAFIDSADEVATKLDLAQAYVDMGDVDGAREILLEVLREGNDSQRGEANVLMSALD